ncbi:MAG TPA: transglutaminase domain-containing protein [Candidatus Limnocylindria bacterium]|nr:transglutaminase domain-containing protein [Candidatus Limnocylindria bacterium]
MPEWLRRYVQPREGWLALALLLVMLLSLGWSVQHTRWIDQTEFIVPIAIYGAVLGALLGLSRLSVVAVLPISAILGAGLLLWAIGGEYYPDASEAERLALAGSEALDWVRILVERGYGPQLVPYAIGFGLTMWVTAFMAAYTIYRHHRVLDAILVVGVPLIANMSSTLVDLFVYLVLFMLAALLLWLRAALIGREETWQRRRVNENVEVPAAIMRSGILFIAGSIALAWVLTTVAVAAPLTAVWNNLDGVWRDARDRLDGVLGGLSNPDARFSGATFGNAYRIDGSFVSSEEPVLTIASQRAYYLRTATYDRYTGHGFARSTVQERRVTAGELLFPGQTPEQPANPDAYDTQTVTISYAKSMGGALFTPGYPVQVTVPAVVLETNGQPIMGGFEAASTVPAGTGYAVTALISTATKAQLNTAGQAYPDSITAMYLGTDGVSTRTRELALQIVRDARAETPFEMAEALANFLRTDDTFQYQTEAPTPRDAEADIVDFFLFDPEGGRTGYCEYYATAMAVMARTLGLPSRVAVGFAPGELVTAAGNEGESNAYLVREGNAHAWAEIYFPGYGWERFEATKTIDPVLRLNGREAPGPEPGASGGPILPSGPPRLSADDRGNISVLPSFQPAPDGFGPTDAGPAGEARGGNLVLIVLIALVAMAVAAWRLRLTRRRMRFLAPAEKQWFRLALAADRAGVGPRPTETIYEYAAWLEEQIPRHRPEIQTIARGKVWQSYSGHSISGEALARIEAAWKRLELPMLWLAIRRRVASLVPSFGRGR